MRHTFESGEWVEILPIGDIRVKHKDQLHDASYVGTPVTESGDIDKAAIALLPGGMHAFDRRWTRHRRNCAVAIVVSEWSWPVPVPVLGPDGELQHEESVGEVDPEVLDLVEPYLDKLTRVPDPKGVTTSSSNGRSKAKVPSPTG